MRESIVAILSGAAGGVGGRVAELGLGSDDGGLGGDETASQAVRLIEQVGENATDAADIPAALDGFAVRSDDGERETAFRHESDTDTGAVAEQRDADSDGDGDGQ
jgi:hypothetical protein